MMSSATAYAFVLHALTKMWGEEANPEAALNKVHDHAVATGLPFQYVLLDSWWYGEGWNGGTALWEDVPECTVSVTACERRLPPGCVSHTGRRCAAGQQHRARQELHRPGSPRLRVARGQLPCWPQGLPQDRWRGED